jgi:hypothetical protein
MGLATKHKGGELAVSKREEKANAKKWDTLAFDVAEEKAGAADVLSSRSGLSRIGCLSHRTP